MIEPEPVEGYRWMRIKEMRECFTPKEIRDLYLRGSRPRDRVIDGKRWVAVPHDSQP